MKPKKIPEFNSRLTSMRLGLPTPSPCTCKNQAFPWFVIMSSLFFQQVGFYHDSRLQSNTDKLDKSTGPDQTLIADPLRSNNTKGYTERVCDVDIFGGSFIPLDGDEVCIISLTMLCYGCGKTARYCQSGSSGHLGMVWDRTHVVLPCLNTHLRANQVSSFNCHRNMISLTKTLK